MIVLRDEFDVGSGVARIAIAVGEAFRSPICSTSLGVMAATTSAMAAKARTERMRHHSMASANRLLTPVR